MKMWESNSGGFMNDSIAEEPQQTIGSVSVGGEEKSKAIAAVSISQIVKLTRPNEGLIMHGKKIFHVNLVAMVWEIIEINPQKIHVLLYDYTSGGPLEVNYIMGDSGTPADDPNLSMFNDNFQSSQESLNSLRVGRYVRCFGVLKFNQDKNLLVAYKMRLIEDPNEITMHTLEIIRDSMYYEKLQKSGSGILEAPIVMENYNAQEQSKNEFGKLSNRDKHVLKYLKDRSKEDGIPLDQIAANLKAFTRASIEESLSILSSEGLCWQGDSEDVWCVNPTD